MKSHKMSRSQRKKLQENKRLQKWISLSGTALLLSGSLAPVFSVAADPKSDFLFPAENQLPIPDKPQDSASPKSAADSKTTQNVLPAAQSDPQSMPPSFPVNKEKRDTTPIGYSYLAQNSSVAVGNESNKHRGGTSLYVTDYFHVNRSSLENLTITSTLPDGLKVNYFSQDVSGATGPSTITLHFEDGSEKTYSSSIVNLDDNSPKVTSFTITVPQVVKTGIVFYSFGANSNAQFSDGTPIKDGDQSKYQVTAMATALDSSGNPDSEATSPVKSEGAIKFRDQLINKDLTANLGPVEMMYGSPDEQADKFNTDVTYNSDSTIHNVLSPIV